MDLNEPASLPTFRPARAEDVPAIVALLADDVLGQAREAPGDPAYLAAFRAIVEDGNQLLVVAEHQGEVAGTMQLSFIPGLSHRGAWRGQIEGVRVAARLRGTGIGGAMIRWAVAECRRRGCRSVQLTTNKTRADAHRFYDRLGFVQSHFGYKLTLDASA